MELSWIKLSMVESHYILSIYFRFGLVWLILRITLHEGPKWTFGYIFWVLWQILIMLDIQCFCYVSTIMYKFHVSFTLMRFKAHITT